MPGPESESRSLSSFTSHIWPGLLCLATVFCVFVALQNFNAHRNDFGHMYVGGAVASRGLDPYDIKLALKAAAHSAPEEHVPRLNPFVYPPFMAVCMIPLSWFSYNGAWLLWTILSHGLVLASGWLLREVLSEGRGDAESPRKALFWAFWMLILCLYYPWIRSLQAGQFNAVMLFGLTLAMYWLQKRRDIRGGCVLGILAGLKVSPALLLLWLFVWRRPHAAISGILTCACTAIVGILALGWRVSAEFVQVAAQMSYGSSTWADYGMAFHVDPANQAPSSVWYRLFTLNPATEALSNLPHLAYGLSALTALIVLGLVTWRTWGEFSIRGFLLGIGSLLLIPSLFWDHYLVQWLPALFFLAFSRKRASILRDSALALAVILICVPFPYGEEVWRHGAGILVPAHKLAGMLIGFGMLMTSEFSCPDSESDCGV